MDNDSCHYNKENYISYIFRLVEKFVQTNLDLIKVAKDFLPTNDRANLFIKLLGDRIDYIIIVRCLRLKGR